MTRPQEHAAWTPNATQEAIRAAVAARLGDAAAAELVAGWAAAELAGDTRPVSADPLLEVDPAELVRLIRQGRRPGYAGVVARTRLRTIARGGRRR